MQGRVGLGEVPRTLLVGNLLPTGRRADPKLTFASGLATSPTLHEFGVIVCSYSNSGFLRAHPLKWQEWQRFLSAGGVAFIVGIEPSLSRHIDQVIGRHVELERETGQELSWKQGPAIYPYVHDRHCSRWSVVIPREHEKDVTAIGRNNAGSPVAFQVSVGPGLVVLLPSCEGSENRKLVRGLIEFGELQWQQRRAAHHLPTWAASIVLESEARLVAEKESLENRL